MTKKEDLLNYLKSNKELFRLQFNIIKIGIFGSSARNEQTENSDIDIIIEMQNNTENIFDKRMALKEKISDYFSIPVDVCHEKAIKPVFREMILNEAVYV